MPLVKIDMIEGRTEADVAALADAVHESMLEEFAAPDRDRYQVITEHRPGQLIFEDTGLGLDRNDSVVLIQVVQQGRTEEQKLALYAGLARRLQERVGLEPSQLVVAVIENTRADWSFGLGRAQFLEGDL